MKFNHCNVISEIHYSMFSTDYGIRIIYRSFTEMNESFQLQNQLLWFTFIGSGYSAVVFNFLNYQIFNLIRDHLTLCKLYAGWYEKMPT